MYPQMRMKVHVDEVKIPVRWSSKDMPQITGDMLGEWHYCAAYECQVSKELMRLTRTQGLPIGQALWTAFRQCTAPCAALDCTCHHHERVLFSSTPGAVRALVADRNKFTTRIVVIC